MSSKRILFYYHSRYCQQIDNSYVFPKFQYILNNFRANKFDVIYIPRQTTKIFLQPFHRLLALIHGFVVSNDKRIARVFNSSNPQPGWFERWYWLLIVVILRPSLVAGFEPSQELCWSCKFFNIKTVDVEHGIRDFNPSTGSYYYRSSYRYLGSVFPDYLLTTFNDEILSSPFYMKLQSKPSLINAGDLELVYSLNYLGVNKDRDCEESNSPSIPLLIVFLSQYTSRISAVAAPLPVHVVNFLQELHHQCTFKFLIRLHPKTSIDLSAKRESMSIYKSQLSFLDFLSFEDGDNSPLVVCLSNADVVVSCDSSALKTAVLLEKNVIYWSNNLQPSSFGEYSRQFLFYLNSSNVSEAINYLQRPGSNAYSNFSSHSAKAQDAFHFLLGLCA